MDLLLFPVLFAAASHSYSLSLSASVNLFLVSLSRNRLSLYMISTGPPRFLVPHHLHVHPTILPHLHSTNWVLALHLQETASGWPSLGQESSLLQAAMEAERGEGWGKGNMVVSWQSGPRFQPAVL